MHQDLIYMTRALHLAERGRYSTQPNPRVGCVIVKQSEIIGEGYHQQAGYAHAEINALARAGKYAKDSDIYINLEPCAHLGKTPPCVDALIAARPKRIIMAMRDPNPLVAGRGVDKLKASGIQTHVGLGQAHATQLNRGFIKRMTKGLPYVTLKLATSMDGRIAMQDGQSTWITSSESRADVHKLRLENGAIITGIGTVLSDNPQLTARIANPLDGYHIIERQPVRVIIDSQGKLESSAKLLTQPGQTWHMVAKSAIKQLPNLADKTFTVAQNEHGLELNKVLKVLAEQQINDVLIEAGGTLAAGFIQAGLIDELIVYQSPDIMGSSAQPMLALPDILNMNQKITYEYSDFRKIGRDIKLTLKPSI